MVAIRLSSFDDVRLARECARDLAQAAGVQDPGAVAQATGELGNNCVEHGSQTPGLLWIGSPVGTHAGLLVLLGGRDDQPRPDAADWPLPMSRALGVRIYDNRA